MSPTEKFETGRALLTDASRSSQHTASRVLSHSAFTAVRPRGVAFNSGSVAFARGAGNNAFVSAP
eukprot:7340858-Prorocentrum_lima.AAC.1